MLAGRETRPMHLQKLPLTVQMKRWVRELPVLEVPIAQSMRLQVQAGGCLGLVVLLRHHWWRA